MSAGVALRLSEELVNKAKQKASVYNRSITKQIEYWAKIGRIAEENPDLPLDFIKGILEAKEELKNTDLSKLEEYNFG